MNRKLLLTHISPRYYSERYEAFRGMAAEMPFPCALAHDDEEFELNQEPERSCIFEEKNVFQRLSFEFH